MCPNLRVFWNSFFLVERFVYCQNILNEDTLQVQHHYCEETPGQDLKSTFVVAAFVTSFARIELYNGMSLMGTKRVLYVDTHSIFLLELDTIPTGNCLRDFKDELHGDEIIEFIALVLNCTITKLET